MKDRNQIIDEIQEIIDAMENEIKFYKKTNDGGAGYLEPYLAILKDVIP